MIRTPDQNSIEARLQSSFFERHAFHLCIGAFILVSAFLYGISAGLRKHSAKAYAGYLPFAEDTGSPAFTRLELPSGVTAVPLGKEVTINDHPAEVAAFVSRRPASVLVKNQLEIWKAAGLKVIGKAGETRGIALAFKESTGERYSFSAWSVPPDFREKVSAGNPTQGFMSVADAQRFGESDQAGGTIPDVPLIPGGKGGAVYSALDPAGRTYTGAYTNPGDIGDNMEFYRSELGSSGWREIDASSGAPAGAKFDVGNLLFQKSGEEIVMLFTPMRTANDSELQTVVEVTRGPLAIERWRAPQ